VVLAIGAFANGLPKLILANFSHHPKDTKGQSSELAQFLQSAGRLVRKSCFAVSEADMSQPAPNETTENPSSPTPETSQQPVTLALNPDENLTPAAREAQALNFKEQGNARFSQEAYEEAYELYSKAILISPTVRFRYRIFFYFFFRFEFTCRILKICQSILPIEALVLCA
jgi:hypothetical protein